MAGNRWFWVVIAAGWVGVNMAGVYWRSDADTATDPDADLPPWPAVKAADSPQREIAERGFVCRLYTDESGRQHRCVVFVPLDIRPGGRPPLIVYLNGAGKSGYDGLGPLKDGLAPAIWETRAHFPCVVVFPQSHERSWPAAGGDAERALAILRKTAESTTPIRTACT